MAKPRVFVSSTYYDLRHIRQGVEAFISSLGYDSVLFESGSIPFSHDQSLDDSCYKEIAACHILVLIVGGRYGTAASEEAARQQVAETHDKQYSYYNSITKKEFETAVAEDIPVYIFVEKGVLAEYQTYKSNRDNSTINYAHVDSVNVFKLLDGIYALKRNNLTRGFENLDDITSWLKDQWAGLFAEFLKKRSSAASLQTLAHQLESLENVTSVLKDYSEKIIEGVSPGESASIKRSLDDKLRSKNAITSLENTMMGAHLVHSHGADPSEILTLIKVAPSVESLQNSLRELVGDCRVPVHEPVAVSEMANLVRRVYDLPELAVPDETAGDGIRFVGDKFGDLFDHTVTEKSQEPSSALRTEKGKPRRPRREGN
jgi:hypothetical protein